MIDRSLAEFVQVHRTVGVDTNVIIALIEQQVDYSPAALSLFNEFTKAQTLVFASAVSVPELLIQPIRAKNRPLVTAYEQRLFAGPLVLADIDHETARLAATLGGQHHLRSLDALIVASLKNAGVTGFVTADQDFSSVDELDVLILTGAKPTKKTMSSGRSKP